MLALKFDGHSVLLDRTAKDPVPAPGEALIRPSRVAICSTDVETVRGGTGFKGILGHEFVGRVVECNVPAGAPAHVVERAKRLKGQRVTGSPNIVCGTCDLCRSGLSAHCRARQVLGLTRDGCFAQAFTLPIVNLHPVPDSIDDDRATFAEPLASAIHAAQMIKIEGKPYITVTGDGKIGLLVVQVMARLNASVRLLGKHPEKFALCERWGIKHRHISEVGQRQDQDVVVDCTGSSAGLTLAMQLVRPRGKIILKSSISPLPMPPGAPVPGADHPAWAAPINLAPIVLNELELLGCRCGPIGDAVDLLSKNQVHVEPLITKRFKLEQGVEAMAFASSKGPIKVLIEIA